MANYSHPTYSFRAVANALSENENMLNYLVSSGSTLEVVAESSQAYDMLMGAFRDETVTDDTVSDIFTKSIAFSVSNPEHSISMNNALSIVKSSLL